MELYYKTTRLKELCENPKYSKKLMRRHKLVGNLDGSFAININNQYRLIFRPYGNNIIIDDLRLIKNIEIMEVSKHYE